MDIFLVVVHDTIIQSREYAVLAKDSEEAKGKVMKGEFLTESEPTTMDHVGESKVISSEKIGSQHHAGA